MIVLLLLAIQYPLAVLAITMGGVTHYQLQAGYVALLAYAVMMSGVGLLCSTICHNSRQASWWTGAFWLTHTLGPPLVKLFLRGGPFGGLLRIPAWLSSPIREVANSLHGLSLFRRLGWILSIGGDESVIDVQVISNFSIGIAAFALGWFALDRVALYRLESEPARPRRLAGILRLGRRPRQLRRPSFAGRCWRTALAWKDFHFLAGGWRFLISKSLVYPFAAIAVLAFASTTGSIPWRQICDQMGAGVLMTIGGTGLLLETSGLASRLFNAEIQQGTLGELMLLPKSIAEISYAKALGMALTLVPAAATFVAGCLMDFEVSGLFFGGMFTVSGLLTMAWYLLFLHLGVWFSIHFRIGGMLLSFVCCYLMLPLAEITRLLLFSGKWETGVQGFLLIIAAMATVGLHVQIGRSVLRKGRL